MTLKVLLIPELFPTDLQPEAGIFMRDQINALSAFAEVMVFNSNPWYRGVYAQDMPARIFDLHLFSSKWPAPLNMLAYRWWEIQSFRLGRKLPRPDIIHLHGAALRGGWALKLATHWKVPLVITEHTGPWSSIANRKLLLRRVKTVMDAADCVLPVSRHLEREITESGIVPARAEVLGNPVDTELFRLGTIPLDARKNILFIGRLDPFKGGMRTLQAFAKVADKLSGYTLTICGTGVEADSIQAFISKHALHERVVFIQQSLTREEMCSHFHQASFLVFPSLFESFGLVGAEAMSTGLPLVVTNRTGPCDYFTEGCGIQVEPSSVDEIAKAMVQMGSTLHLFDPDHIRNSIEKSFGIEKFSHKMKQLYGSFYGK